MNSDWHLVIADDGKVFTFQADRAFYEADGGLHFSMLEPTSESLCASFAAGRWRAYLRAKDEYRLRELLAKNDHMKASTDADRVDDPQP